MLEPNGILEDEGKIPLLWEILCRQIFCLGQCN
jgi:hypothetical protein